MQFVCTFFAVSLHFLCSLFVKTLFFRQNSDNLNTSNGQNRTQFFVFF